MFEPLWLLSVCQAQLLQVFQDMFLLALVIDSRTIYNNGKLLFGVVHKTDVNHMDDQCTIQIQRVSNSLQWICDLGLQIGTQLQNKKKSAWCFSAAFLHWCSGEGSKLFSLFLSLLFLLLIRFKKRAKKIVTRQKCLKFFQYVCLGTYLVTESPFHILGIFSLFSKPAAFYLHNWGLLIKNLCKHWIQYWKSKSCFSFWQQQQKEILPEELSYWTQISHNSCHTSFSHWEHSKIPHTYA